MRRHHHPADAQLGGDGRGVQRPGAAEGDEHEVARIDPALDGQQADRVGHVLVGEVDDGARRRFPVQSQRPRQRVDHRRRTLGVQPQLSAKEEPGVEPAEHQVGVGHGGGVAAGAVAAGTWPGARAFRSYAEHAALVDAGDGAAAGAERAHLDHGNRHRQAPLDLVLGGELRLAVQQQAHVAARAPHVDGDRLPEARLAREVGAADHASGEPGEQQVDRPFGRLGEPGGAAVRLEQRTGAAHVAFAQRLADAPAVAAQQRLQVGVGEGGAGALVLAPQRRDPVREGDRDGGKAPLQERAERKLMGRVEIGEQQADRDRVGAALGDLRRELLHGRGLQRHHHLALGVDTLGHGQAASAPDQRPRLPPVQVVLALAVDALNERDVLEPRCGHVKHLGAAALQHRVGGHRGAVHDALDGGTRNRGLVQHLEQCAQRSVGRGRGLGDAHGPVRAERHQIRECAAGVDAQRQRARGRLLHPVRT